MNVNFDVVKKSASRYDRIWLDITVFDKAGEKYSLCLGNQDGEELCCHVNLDTKNLFSSDGKSLAFSDVSEFAKFLMGAVWNENGNARVEKTKADFVKVVSEKLASTGDVEKILLEKRYEGAYEDADLEHFLPLHDQKLLELAKSAAGASGDDKKVALEAMQAYMGAPDCAGEKTIRYAFCGDVNALAEAICRGEYPEYTVWRECWEIDVKQGTCLEYTEFDLGLK